MSMTWIIPDQIFERGQIYCDRALCFDEGRIKQICKRSELSDDICAQAKRVSGLVCPGFVDLQVNGAGGVQLNNDPSLTGIQSIIKANRDLGTTAVMPTVITDHTSILTQAVAAAIKAKRANTEGFIGLHIEGPHISITRRGTHAEKFVRPFDSHTLDLLKDLRSADVTTLLTIAPEAMSLEEIKVVSDMGVIVSIGHSDTDAQTTQKALDAGACCFTHLYNAMSPMQNREPGVTGVAIDSNAYAGIICDGIHVDPIMVKIACNAKQNKDRMFLVSDAMATLGGPDHFQLYDMHIKLNNGRLINDDGDLAGAHISQAQGVENLVQMIKLTLEDALKMAISTPARLVKAESLEQISGQKLSGLIVLDAHTGRYMNSLQPLAQL